MAEKFLGPTTNGDGTSLAGAHTHVQIAFALDDAGAVKTGKPTLRATPTGEEMTSVIPPEARRAGVSGARVVLRCLLAADGQLQDCGIGDETPPGLGLGAGTLRIADAFRLAVWTAEGLPVVGAPVILPLRFDLAAEPPPPAAGGN